MKKTANDWVEAAARALAHGGMDAVRVERLARALGVTKGSFYWYFKHRQALIDAVLDWWKQLATDAVMVAVEQRGGSARDRLRRLFRESVEDSSLMLHLELALRSAATRSDAIAERVTVVDNARSAYVRSLFGEWLTDPMTVETRTQLFYSLLVGHFLITSTHPTGQREDIDTAALDFLLA